MSKNNTCKITIGKWKDGETWTIRYEDEGDEYYLDKNELLKELSQHMDGMKGD